MLALTHHYDEPVSADGITYIARVYSARLSDGMWGGWIVFFPVGGGRVIATDRETTQSSLADLGYWASGLTPTYLHGALLRAVALQPEQQLATELERLERLEAAAAIRADTLDAAAEAAHNESVIASRARGLTEDRFLATVAEVSQADAETHEAAAEILRQQSDAAADALQTRKRASRSKKKK